MNDGDFQEWAGLEFGSADLGDIRRTRRLVRMASSAAESPAGKITEVFANDAEREAAFRFVENDAIDPMAIGEAAFRATAARSGDFPYVFVPVDGSSLNLADHKQQKRLGIVGARFIGARGLQVMTGIAVSPDGVPLGLCGQSYWAREERSKGSSKKHDTRRVEEKETRYWLEVMQQTRGALQTLAADTQPWFQLDRGGDAWPVILDGLEPGQLFTVRAAHDRRLRSPEDEPRRYLRESIEASTPLGQYALDVLGGPNRTPRTATMEIRSQKIELHLSEKRTGRVFPASITAVLTREISPVPKGQKRIEWLLLTSYAVATAEDAELVIFGYAQRWRVEEFHKIWKSGACKVEETQLGERDRIVRWATILAAVAMRILRLTYLGRRQPSLPADVEFEAVEIDATVRLWKPKGHQRGKMPTIGEMVFWIAKLGGYVGKSSGGPPGAIVIGRGLARIRPAVELLRDVEM